VGRGGGGKGEGEEGDVGRGRGEVEEGGEGEGEGKGRRKERGVGPGRLCLKHHLLFYSFIPQKRAYNSSIIPSFAFHRCRIGHRIAILTYACIEPVTRTLIKNHAITCSEIINNY